VQEALGNVNKQVLANAHAVCAAVQAATSNSSSIPIDAADAAAVLLISALQCVDNMERSAGIDAWQSYSVLATAAAISLDTSNSSSSRVQQVHAALCAILARKEGRAGNLVSCMQLAAAAAVALDAAKTGSSKADALVSSAAGKVAYAQLLNGKALFQLGDAAAALAAFKAAAAAAQEAAAAAAAAKRDSGSTLQAWLDQLLLKLVSL
jgi:hypothetical protein